MRWIATGTAIGFALACGSGSPPTSPGTAATGLETGSTETAETSETGLVGCQGLDEATCSARPDCFPLRGQPGPCPWAGTPSEYAGCMTGEEPLCGDAMTVASPPWDPDGCWLFGSLCRPDGWTSNPACGGPDIDDAGCP